MTAQLLPDDPHDRQLVARVHPPAWANPTPKPDYHLVVIGGGTAGLVSSAGAGYIGARVALVERNLLGGDCLNVGCVPSKALLAAARVAGPLRRAGNLGVRVGPVEVDFPAVMERMRRLRAEMSRHDSAERFTGLGVDVFLGDARFTERDTVEVGGQVLRFRKAVIATGTRAAVPNVPGLAEAGVLTNETLFTLTALPRRLAVIGAGPVGCEMAQAFARFGSQVTLLDVEPRVLPREDEDAALLVQKALADDGVAFLGQAKLLRAERRGDERVLHLECAREVVADAVLVAAGRRPNVEGLGLEAAGVEHGPHGVAVDDWLRTTNTRIYAAGDITGKYAFTHAADAMARIAVKNSLVWGWSQLSALTIPWCTYTSPELGRVGLSLAEAKERGLKVDVFEQPFASVDRAVLDGETEGFVRVLAQGGTILGATVVGAEAGDLVGVLGHMMATGAGLSGLSSIIAPYPTRLEALRKLGDAYNRTRLTPWVKWLLKWWIG
jgi:pyruvate/2-oxoglutarate dehydrogenase complex dihydrolipoamide dehydrogenase (E3) component